ncbi:hypothetical protein AAKU55_000161 [Oxalobacteraceae bacterium GrIS 1.11]
MSSPALERFLARLYSDAALRQRFLADPQQGVAGAGLSASEQAALCELDRAGLQMAAASYEHKRARRGKGSASVCAAIEGWWRSRLRSIFRRS